MEFRTVDDPQKPIEYTEEDRPACPVCDELAGSCDHPEVEALYRVFRGEED